VCYAIALVEARVARERGLESVDLIDISED
jgi:hypothetical protein